MRIKYLKIRNIASIEQADIDFENDLRHESETSPAPLFLITGDTGAGKSVILDSISMALYGTTPRVKGVANRSNNSFIGSEGKEISIQDISQYTRLGISSKDDCFVELTFEGNDGITYISRFSLGYVRTGNYRPVAWRLQIGDSEVLEGSRKEEIKNRILQAIGLTYDQFCRMAMLAQGQFASFLTGAKEERERILEQLTSTQHFSRYGEAIERIFKRAKQNKEEAEKLLAAEQKHLLAEDEENACREQFQLLEKDIDALKRDKSELEEQISLLSNLQSKEEDLKRISHDLEVLKAREGSNDFSLKKDILNKWDSTLNERNLLNKKIETTESLNNRVQTFASLLSQKEILSKNLAKRESVLADKNNALSMLSEQLKAYEPYKRIYQNISLIKEKFNQRKQSINEIEAKIKALTKEREATTTLKANLDETTKSAKNALDLLNDKRKIIASMDEEREKLNPDTNAKELETASARRNDLENIITLLKSAEESATNLNNSIAERNKLEDAVGKQKEIVSHSHKEAQRTLGLFEDARKRYDTMHLSVEENFSDLRRRLSEEKVCTCPLCGQAKDWHDTNAEFNSTFSNILSPLESERDRLKKESDSAETIFQEENRIYNQATGMLAAQDKTVASLTKQYDRWINSLDKSLSKLSITESHDNASLESDKFPFEKIGNEIQSAITLINKDIAHFIEIKQKADDIQKNINLQINECRPLETAVTQTEKTRNEANTRFVLNSERIFSLEKDIKDLSHKIEQRETEIDSLIGCHSPEWRMNPSDTATLLSSQAQAYEELTNAEKIKAEEIKIYSNAINSLISIESEIDGNISQFPELQPSLEDPSLESYQNIIDEKKIENLDKDWHKIYTDFTAEGRNILRDRNQISDLNKKLNEYYIESGTDENQLIALCKLELSIPEIRAAVNEMQTSIYTQSENLKTTRIAIDDLQGKLMIKTKFENREEFPSLDDLKVQKSEIDAKWQKCSSEWGVVKERLDQNMRTKERVAEELRALEIKRENFSKWDQLNRHFGGNRFRTLVQSYILRPLLQNANIYLRRITDHFTLTCSESNEQLSILVLDRYNKNKIRSATVLSGGERFMISLALSLALSAMNKPDLNVDILFIDEGFGTLDAGSLNAVIDTLRRLPEIAGNNGRRVGVISHREELSDCIDVQIRVNKCGEGRSRVEIVKD